MLRNVLEDYLNSINERDFDYPLSFLLQGMGFYDIHFTHGAVEFGKDFIAKRVEDGTEYQYAIQSKKGDIGQGLWRNEIRGQLEEAISSDLSHPQFNTSLPRKVILVTTGRLSGNARLASQEFKTKLAREDQVQDLIFWEREQLIQYAEEYGLTGIYQNTAKGLRGLAQFYLTYSRAIDGSLSDREMEQFSRLWLDEELDYKKRILRASIEAEIIASKLIEGGHLYEASVVYLSLARIIMRVIFENDDPFLVAIFEELKKETILPLLKKFFEQFKADWEGVDKVLTRLCFPQSYFPVANYLVWCARVVEQASLYNFLLEDQEEKDRVIAFIIEFIEREEGCGHLPGDRYTVTTVWTTLALLKAGKVDEAINFIKRNVIWLCDRVDKGFGLAHYDAEEYEESAYLVGYPFEAIDIKHNQSSYLATALADLAAFIEGREFYADVVNDIEASEIAYNYWQLPDTASIFTIETKEVLFYPNDPHQFDLTAFEEYIYAEHIKHEPDSYQITGKAGVSSLILLSILLKDRFFPKMWRQIVSEGEAAAGTQEARGQAQAAPSRSAGELSSTA
jgi:hypothetical protein